ncbi:hypothetical protein ACHAW5_007942 [Stephanodiscus triporus]|uniref:Cyclin N-terminal domain-containing protein n=1 Tax=Stephanodiscus triporus TaxID=2934178 RepID=A0ABD3PEC8_9STRA
MFVYQDAAAAVAMQEIEVINMDDGEDNVTTTSISSPPSMVSTLPSLHAQQTTSSFDHYRMPESSPALDALVAMLANERMLPAMDHKARSSIDATPISISSATATPADAALRTAAREREDISDPVNDCDRTKMCDWYYEMSDFLKIDWATASRSLSLLDRFIAAPVHRMVRTASSYPSLITSSSSSLSSSSASMPDGEDLQQDRPYNVAGVVIAASRIRDEYQLAALTALFLSIKLFERLNIQPEHVGYLSRGRYTSGEVMKMELVILHALEWRVCCAEKFDFVEAYLDVMLPEKHVGDPYHHTLLSSIKDLSNLQVKMSDFESSFSKQRPSLVAFASVINAFDMRKDEMSNFDQHYFLQSARGLMARMDHQEQREELSRTAERLRALVDPPSAARHGSIQYFICGGQSSPSSVDMILHHHETSSCREGGGAGINVDDSSLSSSRTDSQRYAKVSPLDVALESMENLNVARLLCCGSVDRSFHQHTNSTNDRHRVDRCGIIPGKKQQQGHATTSGGSESMAKSHSSPTSISSIIFGATAKKL